MKARLEYRLIVGASSAERAYAITSPMLILTFCASYSSKRFGTSIYRPHQIELFLTYKTRDKWMKIFKDN